MPNNLPLSQEAINEYNKYGTLNDEVVGAVAITKSSMRFGQSYAATAEQLSTFKRVVADRKSIDIMLDRFTGSKPLTESSFDVTEQGLNGYTLRRCDFLGGQGIVVKRASDNFFWALGIIKDQQSDLQLSIQGFYHMNTNGNLADVTAAFENTKHLFPRCERARKRPAVFTYEELGHNSNRRARYSTS